MRHASRRLAATDGAHPSAAARRARTLHRRHRRLFLVPISIVLYASRQRRKAPAPVHTRRAAARVGNCMAGAGSIGPAACIRWMRETRRAVTNSAPGRTGVAVARTPGPVCVCTAGRWPPLGRRRLEFGGTEGVTAARSAMRQLPCCVRGIRLAAPDSSCTVVRRSGKRLPFSLQARSSRVIRIS